MELLICSRTYTKSNTVFNFIDFYHSLNMYYLASDLLDK